MKERQHPPVLEVLTPGERMPFTDSTYGHPTKQPEVKCAEVIATARLPRQDANRSENDGRRRKSARLKLVASATGAPVRDEGLQGEIIHGLFTQMVGLYTWQARQPLTEGEIQAGLTERILSDLRRLHYLPRNVQLTDWHGGWTQEGTGIFAAEVWNRAGNGRSRHLGRVSLTVGNMNQEFRRTVHIAC
jgi:hypothetical protein